MADPVLMKGHKKPITKVVELPCPGCDGFADPWCTVCEGFGTIEGTIKVYRQ